MHYPLVFIIILNWNGLEDTLECLSSVTKLNYPNFKIIVVDNGSSDDSVAIIHETYHQVILIVNNENLGYTGGNNIGIRYAMEHGADYCWLLNNDTIVQNDSLTILIKAAENNQKVGLISPILYRYDEPDSIQFCGSYADLEKYSIIMIDHPETIAFTSEKIIILWGTALLIKADVIAKIGLLNDKYFAYHEDCEYGMRAAQAGYLSMVESQAIVYHKRSKSTGNRNSPVQCFLRMRNLWFLWADGLAGLKKIHYFRHFLGDVLSAMAQLMDKGLNESIDATLEGVWCALHGQGGLPHTKMSSPKWFRRTLYLFAKRHPYFWKHLLRGNFSGIKLEFLKRAKLKIKGHEN